MKIKSLLLGSAAALVAVSGAQAADAIVVEAEPVQYVEICDTYGAGYFKIPGGDTCLKIGGSVRITYTGKRYHDDTKNNISNHSVNVRGQLTFDAKNETDYGTLSSRIVLNNTRSEVSDFDHDSDANTAGVHDAFSKEEGHKSGAGMAEAWMKLGNISAGYRDSTWTRIAGSGYYNAINSGYSRAGNTGIFLEYDGSAGDLQYVVGIQDGNASGSSGQPDLYAQLKYSMGGLSIGGAVVYDTNGWDDKDNDKAQDADEYSGAIAYYVRGDYDLSDMMPGASIGAWMSNDDGKTDYVKGHRWGVTMKADITDGMTAYAGYSAWNQETAADKAHWSAGISWAVVDGLSLQGEWTKERELKGDSTDTFSLRATRSF